MRAWKINGGGFGLKNGLYVKELASLNLKKKQWHQAWCTKHVGCVVLWTIPTPGKTKRTRSQCVRCKGNTFSMKVPPLCDLCSWLDFTNQFYFLSWRWLAFDSCHWRFYQQIAGGGGGIYSFSIQDCFERWKDNRMLSLFKRVILLTRKQLATVFARSWGPRNENLIQC